jgi:hypothetical protein
MVSTGVVLRRALSLGRPSADGRRPALPKQAASHLLPAPIEELGNRLPAPQQLVWLLLRPAAALTPSDHQVLQDRWRDKDLETAYTLPQRFRQRLRHRTAAALEPWLMNGHASGMPELVNFASGLQREHPAGSHLARPRTIRFPSQPLFARISLKITMDPGIVSRKD